MKALKTDWPFNVKSSHLYPLSASNYKIALFCLTLSLKAGTVSCLRPFLPQHAWYHYCPLLCTCPICPSFPYPNLAPLTLSFHPIYLFIHTPKKPLAIQILKKKKCKKLPSPYISPSSYHPLLSFFSLERDCQGSDPFFSWAKPDTTILQTLLS